MSEFISGLPSFIQLPFMVIGIILCMSLIAFVLGGGGTNSDDPFQ